MPLRPHDNRNAGAALSPWVCHLARLACALDRVACLRIALKPFHRLCLSPRLAVARATHPGLLRPSGGCLMTLRRTAQRSCLWMMGLCMGLAAWPMAGAAQPTPALQIAASRRQADEPPKPPPPRSRKTRLADAMAALNGRVV